MPTPLPLPRRQALEHHLRFNHYPPVHLSFVDPCEAAIECIEQWRFDVYDMSSIDEKNIEITIPGGAGTVMASARDVADMFHLWDFVPVTHDDD
jgi:hypothetical protein